MYLVYGISVDTGQLVHIDNVQNGINCRCVCPACGETLIAKQGNIRQSHFAHMNTECSNANESALHLAVKNILNEQKKIWLPMISINRNVLFSPKVIELTNTRLEPWFDGFRPDIICEYQSPQHNKSVQLIVEVAVTSFINKVKAERIRDKGVSCVEINLSTIDRIPNHDYLVNLLTNENKLIKWVHSVKLDREYQKQKNKIQKDTNNSPSNAQLIILNQRKKLLPDLDKLLEFKKNSQIYLQSTDVTLVKMAKLLGFYPNEFPAFLNIECPDDYVLGCDRRVWQSIFYYAFFIHNERYRTRRGGFKTKEVYDWLKNKVSEVKIPYYVSRLSYEKYKIQKHFLKGCYGPLSPPLTQIELDQIPNPFYTVEFYLNKLCELDLLEFETFRNGNEYYYTGNLFKTK